MSQIVDSIAFRRPVQFNDGQAPIPTIAPNHFLNPYASSDWTRKSNVHAIADNNIASKRYERTTVDKPNRASGYSQSSTKDVQKRSSSLVPNHLIPAITQLPVYQGEDVSHVSALTSMPATGMVMRHARVELSMHLNSMMCVSGGFASGHLELQCKSRHGVRFGEIWVELQGYEQGNWMCN
ncbi:hypothetical protein BDF19DRAFT_414400 [Syncephalis fuscata]|nr:hypothetical protein BDF19DRAFT_414400 [Syncephalis fuscata]